MQMMCYCRIALNPWSVMDTTDHDFVYGDSHLIGLDGEDLGPAYSWSTYSRFRLLNGMFIHHPRMFRSSVFARTDGFNVELSNAVDFDFYLQLSLHARGYHLQMPLYLYRQHTTNTSKINRQKQDNNTLVALERVFLQWGWGADYAQTLADDARKFNKSIQKNIDDYGLKMESGLPPPWDHSPSKERLMAWELRHVVSRSATSA